jgi:hypothetical protein
MAKKKIDYVVVAAALAGLLLGAASLGHPLLAVNIVSILAAGLGAYLIYLGFQSKEADWTFIVGGAIYIAHYLVAPGLVMGGYDIHVSLMTSAGLMGLILLLTRYQK